MGVLVEIKIVATIQRQKYGQKRNKLFSIEIGKSNPINNLSDS